MPSCWTMRPVFRLGNLPRRMPPVGRTTALARWWSSPLGARPFQVPRQVTCVIANSNHRREIGHALRRHAVIDMPISRQQNALPPVKNYRNVQQQRGIGLTRLWRVAILSLSRASRESRVKADQAERFDPFLHLRLHVLAATHPLHGVDLLAEDDIR